MPAKYRLTYFNVKGRCEHIRYIFAAAGVPFDDVRITKEQWTDIKPNTPFGGMPILEVDGRMIGQSSTIARYVARECNLAGQSSIDMAIADSIAETALEIREKHMIPMVYEEDEAQKAEIIVRKCAEEVLPKMMTDFEKILGDQDFLVNNQLSWADIMVFHVLEMLSEGNPLSDAVDKHPKIRALEKRVRELPGIAKYMKERPQTPY